MDKRQVVNKRIVRKTGHIYLMKCLVCGTEFEVSGGSFNQGIGYTCSNECRSIRHSQKLKGKPTWIKGKTKKDYPQLEGYWTGKKFSEEHKKKLSITRKANPNRYWKGKKKSKKHCAKISNTLKGKHTSIKTEFKNERIPWNKGMKMPKEHCKKLSKIHKAKPNRYWLGKERLDMKGDKHHNWLGGKSFEPYTNEFTKFLKQEVRKRDNYVCQLCGKKEEDEFCGKRKYKLSIHHIDYNKNNCVVDNLTTLCRPCNSKVNKNREYWTQHFVMKIKGRNNSNY